MKFKTIVLICFFVMGTSAFGQADTNESTATETGGPQAEYIGVDSAQQELAEISLSKFEDDGYWTAYMPTDEGLISLRRFEGTPLDKRKLEEEEKSGIVEEDRYVLGAKVNHIHRAATYFSVKPLRPIPIPGKTKILSLWIVGRNVRHSLYAIVNDHFGNRAKISMGELNFTGWKELRATIPPHIRQQDPRYNNKTGIQVTEFLIETDPAETYGNYYFYMDDLRAVTDLFSENNRDADDMADYW
ncbi:MAG: flagellar filament protein FlaA [Spirochaetes bacterium GWB1_48_6]|nr:MAG: flagellar filament protein FlaA [Spirochaetes bacterium GWB1_48_6]